VLPQGLDSSAASIHNRRARVRALLCRCGCMEKRLAHPRHRSVAGKMARLEGFEPPTNGFGRLKSVPTALYLGLFGLAVDAGRKRLVWPREHAHRAAWSPCVEPDDRPLVRLGGGPGPRQTAVRVSRLGESCLKGEAKAMVESRRPRGWARMIRNRINGVPRQFDPGRCCRASRKGASSPAEVGLEHAIHPS
jgi:hypothetical protein